MQQRFQCQTEDIFSPVIHAESSEARNTATFAISSGCPVRPSGVLATNFVSKNEIT